MHILQYSLMALRIDGRGSFLFVIFASHIQAISLHLLGQEYTQLAGALEPDLPMEFCRKPILGGVSPVQDMGHQPLQFFSISLIFRQHPIPRIQKELLVVDLINISFHSASRQWVVVFVSDFCVAVGGVGGFHAPVLKSSILSAMLLAQRGMASVARLQFLRELFLLLILGLNQKVPSGLSHTKPSIMSCPLISFTTLKTAISFSIYMLFSCGTVLILATHLMKSKQISLNIFMSLKTCTQKLHMEKNMEQKQRRIVFQAALSEDDLAKLKAIADHRGEKMSYVFRNWVRSAYDRLPAEAKEQS